MCDFLWCISHPWSSHFRSFLGHLVLDHNIAYSPPPPRPLRLGENLRGRRGGGRNLPALHHFPLAVVSITAEKAEARAFSNILCMLTGRDACESGGARY